MIYPIIAVVENGSVKRVPRTSGHGWIDPKEQFGYIKMNFWKRGSFVEELSALDNVTVEKRSS